MTRVVVPVRYPLTDRSRQTLERAVEVAAERDAELTILHVNLYQEGKEVSRAALKRAVRDAVGPIDRSRHVVRSGFIVEERILDEVAAEEADVVVIGRSQAPRWRRLIGRIVDDPDVETFLQEHLDCELIIVPTEV